MEDCPIYVLIKGSDVGPYALKGTRMVRWGNG